MPLFFTSLTILTAVLPTFAASFASAQTFPNKPITVVVPFAAEYDQMGGRCTRIAGAGGEVSQFPPRLRGRRAKTEQIVRNNPGQPGVN